MGDPRERGRYAGRKRNVATFHLAVNAAFVMRFPTRLGPPRDNSFNAQHLSRLQEMIVEARA